MAIDNSNSNIIAALIAWLSYLAVVPAEKKLPTTDDYFPMPSREHLI